jgi:hypothetical protein
MQIPDYEVHLILPGVEEWCEDNVQINNVLKVEGLRLKRMWTTVNYIYKYTT